MCFYLDYSLVRDIDVVYVMIINSCAMELYNGDLIIDCLLGKGKDFGKLL